MSKLNTALNGMTDEEVLAEFVDRFHCDGAILIYLATNIEYGFAKWGNPQGHEWADELFNYAQNRVGILFNKQNIPASVKIPEVVI